MSMTTQPDAIDPKDDGMPEGEELQQQLKLVTTAARSGRRSSSMALVVAMVALAVLLANIINQTFGLVAIENNIDPGQLVQAAVEGSMEAMPNTVASEDDLALAQSIADDPYGVGFFGYAFYENQADQLRALAVDGVEPSATAVEAGTYELSRAPLPLHGRKRSDQRAAGHDLFGLLPEQRQRHYRRGGLLPDQPGSDR